MDFYQIKEERGRGGIIEIYPDFKVCRSKDLMIRGNSFYAIWDEEKGLWSTDEYDAQRLIDNDLRNYFNELKSKTDAYIKVKYLCDFSSRSWMEFVKYTTSISDNFHPLDMKITFANTDVKKKDYVSKRLPYPIEEGPINAYDEIMSTLYSEENRAKLEWAIGSIIAGDSVNIQKFIVLYGEQGSGKSTVLNIIEKLFSGYYSTFDAKALGSTSNQFAAEVFRSDPLVAIQHDGDLSGIADNTKINSIVSHENMVINVKHKSAYTSKTCAFLFMGTNKPVKITDAKSGIIRRLIDVNPTGNLIPGKRYDVLKNQIDFELSGIAYHCLNVYRSMGKNYYQNYKPLDMMFKTDPFFNFVESNYDFFYQQDACTFTQAYELYKIYCEDFPPNYKLPQYKFREELKNYFDNFDSVKRIEGKQVRSYYSGFKTDKFEQQLQSNQHPVSLTLDCDISLLDEMYPEAKAQYAKQLKDGKEIPMKKWSECETLLKDLDTKKIHYFKPPEENHIVIDFDIKDSEGNKSKELNLEAASKWPPTYAEFSKGGCGIHLHYIYDGDVSMLSNIYDKDIEIKKNIGNSAIRRRLTKCNNVPIATINSGLPLKKGKKMINDNVVMTEAKLVEKIKANLNKEIHGSTASSVSYIKKLLDDYYASGRVYDVTYLKRKVMDFALGSRHQSANCIKMFKEMKFKSDTVYDDIPFDNSNPRVFFDIEVYPNVIIICWKYEDLDPIYTMINPSAIDIDDFIKKRLVGFNNRKYDNHILYAIKIGWNNKQVYDLSAALVTGHSERMFREAFNISETDVYDFSVKKQSLKKWEIELDQLHMEMSFKWDEPLDEQYWPKVIEYCSNDVRATESVFKYLKPDFECREIIADISGLTINNKTNSHSERFMFNGDKNPQKEFVYTDLSEMFPGYEYNPFGIDKSRYAPDAKIVNGKSIYKGQDPSEGGRVFARPGVWGNVYLLDVASMHPTSIEQLNLFGKYTKNFSALKHARLLIKHLSQAYDADDVDKIAELTDELSTMFNGKLVKYIQDRDKLKALSSALKIVINSVYGLTSAKFENAFKDPRNVDNIVAKRGSLFMIDLQEAVEKEGYTVVHIKTDSIKVADGDEYIKNFIMEFGKKYGYTFEHEATYEKMCLVNDSVYIAQYKDPHEGEWTATGAQFAHPYVFKTLFSKEEIIFKDMCETKSVQSALYLDMNEDLQDVHEEEIELEKRDKNERLGKNIKLNPKYSGMSNEELKEMIACGHDYKFVGRVGSFCPVLPGKGGGILLRQQDNKMYAAAGTSGYRWMEAENIKMLGNENDIDKSYFEALVSAASDQILKYAELKWFCSNDKYVRYESPIWPF